MKEFIINNYLKLRLVNNETVIFVNNERFSQCKHLILNIPKDHIEDLDEIDSIDEAKELLKKSSAINIKRKSIPPEVEFWGHCSNLQAWAENNYDTRLLHSNLAFPLLKKLNEVGDPKAKKVFKEEIAIRFSSGYLPVMTYLIKEGFLGYLNENEFRSLIEDIVESSNYNLIKKEFGVAWGELGLNYLFQKDYNKAIESFKFSLEFDSNDSDIWNWLGHAYYMIRKYDNAIGALKRSLEINPYFEKAWNNLGLVYRDDGQSDEAIEAFKNALNVDLEFTVAWKNLGYSYHDIGKYNNAIEAFKCAININQNYKEFWNDINSERLINGESSKTKRSSFLIEFFKKYEDNMRKIKSFIEDFLKKKKELAV